ncbi:MerR family transcriptional regulator [Pseudonocardia sp. TRM90224]|uniref:MerR family transcriptional regulator n=1 Tax=Pseudonocardia sp. TRM90224 TaxID=2812678 RepID=UPI001E37FA43|nr:MerR family transcriptional regulator [Pseudonocardia sp. TRM90224]
MTDETGQQLTPVGAVAQRFKLAVSTLHYWERRGLIRPAARTGGRRWYDADGVHRVAAIATLRSAGMLSLDDIAHVLDRPADDPGWRGAVEARVDAFRTQVKELESAQGYLEHLLTCPSHDPAHRCPYLQQEFERRYPTTEDVDLNPD